MIKFVISLVLCISLSRSAYTPDLVNIQQVPLWNVFTNYTHKIYSGYLTIDANNAQHYLFFESQKNPSKDPLILWLNGGPGCSSMLGAAYEHGPFVFPDGSMTPIWNNYSWNTNANVIYMESPSCIGFSYCANPQENFTDPSTTEGNLAALISFFEKFPEYLNNDFYVMGESYAGVYVPYLTYYIDQFNNNASNVFQINLKGFAAGDPVTHPFYDTYSDLWFWSGHGLLAPDVQELIEQSCQPDDLSSDICGNLMSDLYDDLLQNVNIYDIYRYCYFDNSSQLNKVEHRRDRHSRRYQEFEHGEGSEPDPGRPPCIDDVGAYYWLNNATTRNALHIWPNVSTWYMCKGINYYPGANASFWIYPYLIQKGYKILVYSGESDGSVPTDGTLLWVQELYNQGIITLKRPQMSWTIPGKVPGQPQVQGYVTVYKNFQFVSVNGIGHMVPQWNRPAAYKMIYAFLNEQVLT